MFQKKKVVIKIFGDGVELQKLKKFKKENNIRDVHFYGKVSKNRIIKELFGIEWRLFTYFKKDFWKQFILILTLRFDF